MDTVHLRLTASKYCLANRNPERLLFRITEFQDFQSLEHKRL